MSTAASNIARGTVVVSVGTALALGAAQLSAQDAPVAAHPSAPAPVTVYRYGPDEQCRPSPANRPGSDLTDECTRVWWT